MITEKNKLKILQLGKFYPVRGGVEKVVYSLTMGLAEQGIECDMMCAAWKGKGQVIRLASKAQLYCCRTLFHLAATMVSPSMVSMLRRVCTHYDIIHVHHPDPMAALALWLSGYKGKVVLHWHSDIIRQKQFLRLYLPLQNWLIRRADLIVGTSPVYLAESDYLKDVQDKTVCLPIGIERVASNPEMAETIRQRYGNRKIVFSLGRLVYYKGFKHLIDAAAYLNDEYVVLIGGTGPLQAELQAQIDQQGLSDKVKLLGRLSDEELAGYYEACRMFCLSSVQKTEAFAIVQVEAMSCGKPIVATNIPQSGVAWVNAHGESGLNVEPGNPEQLAKAIMDISENEQAYAQFSRRSKKRYETMFTQRMMIDKSMKMYLDLWKKN